MIHKFRNVIIVLSLALGTLLLFSCGDLPEEETAERTLSSISISPSSVSLEVDDTQIFSVTVHYSDATISSPQASWNVTGGIGTITSLGSTATFTATAEESGSVEASYSGKNASASVTVSAVIEPGGLATIEVSSTATLRVGESETFSASGTDATGEAVDISPTWVVSGDAIGILSVYETVATLEVTAEGTATISCTSGEVVGYSYVTVEGYFIEITAEVDTYVSSSDTGSHGSESILKSGRMIDPSTVLYETYIIFDISFIDSGSTIESANLKLYCSSTDGAAMNIGQLAQSWTGSTTWAARPSQETFVLANVFAYGTNEVEFTDGVQYWLDTDNYGIVIYLDDPAVGFANFVSRDETVYLERRPTLQLEYITP